MECKRWVVECTCRADSWELVVKEFMDLYLFCEVSVYPEDDIVVVRSNELSYHPTEDNTKVSADFDIFLDAIRNYANYGWPENDPVSIIERDYSMFDPK